MGKKTIPDGASRGDIFAIDPNKLTIIGARVYTQNDADTEDGTSHPLWDPRIQGLKPEAIDMAHVKNVAVYGVQEPVLIKKIVDGDETRLVVIDGRHRVVWARMANALRVKEGLEPQKVPYITKAGDDDLAVGLGISLNYVRVDDSPMQTARNIARRKNAGKKTEELCQEFGLSKQSVANYLSLLELHPDVQKAVDDGILKLSKAYELAKVKREEQPAMMAKVVEVGASAREVKDEVRRKKNGGEGEGEEDEGPSTRAFARPSVGDLRKILKYTEEDRKALKAFDTETMLMWVAGELKYNRIRGLAELLRAAKVIE